jgi:translation initiation factor IF-3
MTSLPRFPGPPSSRDRFPGPAHSINEQIRLSPICLIGANGEPLGIVPTAPARAVAREAGLGLVEVAAQERPPVCRVMDYGKFKFEQSHKAKKSKTQQQRLKEIRVRPKTGEHDVEAKVSQARKFLGHQDRVQVYVLFRGRELQHLHEGRRVLEVILGKLADVAKVERPPLMEGKRLVATLAPR